MTFKTEQFYIRRIAELKKQVAELVKVNGELTDKIAKLSKNSSNSSKPPSSDIFKPSRKKKNNGSRNVGGQPGHTKHERRPFAASCIASAPPTAPLQQCTTGQGDNPLIVTGT